MEAIYVELFFNEGDSVVFADAELSVEQDVEQNVIITSQGGVMLFISHQNIIQEYHDQKNDIYEMINNSTLKIFKHLAA